MIFKNVFLYFFVVILITSCLSGNKKSNVQQTSESADSLYIPKYANLFKIKYFNDHKVIEVNHPWDSAAPPLVTLLSDDPQFLRANPSAIKIPVERWVSVASTQISYANKLNVLDRLVGMAEPEYVSNSIVKEGIRNGSIRNVGTAFSPDLELLISLNPDMMMISPFKDDFYEPLRSVGVKLTTNSSYLENTPLGRVEWLVFVSAFFNKEKMGIEVVKDIAQRYNKIKQFAKNAIYKPTVVTGKTYQGIWYVPAAESYNANFLKDASVKYIFSDRHGTGSLSYDFETVYEAAGECDFWSMLVNYNGEYSYTVLSNLDDRYCDFRAFKTKNIIYSNTSHSLFYEKGLLEPDVVLTDLVKLFHPELLVDYKTVYYNRLIKE